jgi:hypothetical protein
VALGRPAVPVRQAAPGLEADDPVGVEEQDGGTIGREGVDKGVEGGLVDRFDGRGRDRGRGQPVNRVEMADAIGGGQDPLPVIGRSSSSPARDARFLVLSDTTMSSFLPLR